MINYHFGGKRKLYLAILSATFAEIVAGVERLAESTRPAPEVLRDLVAMVGEVATRRHPHFCTMMLREVVAGGRHLESGGDGQAGAHAGGRAAHRGRAVSARATSARSIRC